MSHSRNRPLWIALGAIVLAWLVAWSGYVISKHSKMTVEKVNKYQSSLDFARMSAAERMKALQELANRVNALSLEDRQGWHLDLDWFRQLTDEEKAFFIDAFMPGEMRQAMKMFERWPIERQRSEIDHAMNELRRHAADPAANPISNLNGTNGPMLTPEMDKQIRTIGLNALYSQGSAQTKAQLAPLLMEVQRQFESGQLSLSKF